MVSEEDICVNNYKTPNFPEITSTFELLIF